MTGRTVVFREIEAIVIGRSLGRADGLHVIAGHVSVINESAGVCIGTLHRAVNAVERKLHFFQRLDAAFGLYGCRGLHVEPIVAARGDQDGNQKEGDIFQAIHDSIIFLRLEVHV